MRRIGVVLLVMAMGLVIASPVGAAKPDCNLDPSHPSCNDEPADEQGGGITCAEHATWKGQENLITDVEVHEDHFDIELSGKNVRACIDVMSDEGVWRVDIQLLEGTVRSMGLIPRDSVAPGDSCGGVILSRGDIPLSIGGEIPLSVEGAYVNSCGVDFAELIDGVSYSDFETEIPSPLAFQASMAGSKDAHVILHVHVPEYTPPTP